jgi:hypothetical protein
MMFKKIKEHPKRGGGFWHCNICNKNIHDKKKTHNREIHGKEATPKNGENGTNKKKVVAKKNKEPVAIVDIRDMDEEEEPRNGSKSKQKKNTKER